MTDDDHGSPTADLAPAVRKGDRRPGREGRSGYTTGANAAAAALAATLGLARGMVPTRVACLLPNGQRVTFAIAEGRVEGDRARAVSIKDAGDDPDATNGAHLTAEVRRMRGGGGVVTLDGGPGVGIVTLPGLGLTVGAAAINPVPRHNIVANVQAAGARILAAGDGLAVIVSVPGGEAMARKTLNARLGILGGISILGTSGIVRPYSTAAFRASVVQAIGMAARQGQTTLALTTGRRTERAAMDAFPALPEVCFIQMGDFVKAAFTAAVKHRMEHLIVGAMVGKLTKMAQGLPVTHAWRAPLDRDLIADVAAGIGAPAALVALIRDAATARFAAERLESLGLGVELHQALVRRSLSSLRRCYPGPHRLTVLACDVAGLPIVTVVEDAHV
jgi:cobalt-precorrin-5B (C1)-methyltransferase